MGFCSYKTSFFIIQKFFPFIKWVFSYFLAYKALWAFLLEEPQPVFHTLTAPRHSQSIDQQNSFHRSATKFNQSTTKFNRSTTKFNWSKTKNNRSATIFFRSTTKNNRSKQQNSIDQHQNSINRSTTNLNLINSNHKPQNRIDQQHFSIDRSATKNTRSATKFNWSATKFYRSATKNNRSATKNNRSATKFIKSPNTNTFWEPIPHIFPNVLFTWFLLVHIGIYLADTVLFLFIRIYIPRLAKYKSRTVVFETLKKSWWVLIFLQNRTFSASISIELNSFVTTPVMSSEVLWYLPRPSTASRTVWNFVGVPLYKKKIEKMLFNLECLIEQKKIYIYII